ncbi:MAG: hypothetical protein IPJ77_21820 [Planctomycetes bacterium]|nr:hypothetical protein [Planctomycetota bacterium]
MSPTSPEHEPTRARSILLVALGVVAVAAAIAWLFVGTGPSDDDFIVQRYARNFVDGRGLVFDDGVRVEGFTCPLWLFLLAGVMALGGTAAAVGPWIGSAAVAGSALLALARARATVGEHASIARGGAVAAAFAIAASAATAYHAALGLGTALAGFLVLAWFVAAERAERRGSSHVLAGVCLGLATLLRPETAGLALPWLVAVPRGRRIVAGLAFAAWSGGWLVFRVAYYGEWLPMTHYVKKLALVDDLAYGADYLARATLDTGVVLLFGVGVLARLLRRAPSGRMTTAALAGVGVSLALVAWAGGDYMPVARFVVPVLPLLLVLACDAIAELLAHRVVLARAALLVLVAFGAWPCLELAELQGRHRFYEERWIAIGKELGARFPADTRVATAPIGAIGFHSRLPIVDLLGLTNAAVRRAEPDLSITMKGHHRYDADWALAQEPDLVLLGNGVLLPGQRTLQVSAWERTLVQHPRFAAEYEQLVLPIPGSYDLFLFRRRASAGRSPGAR